MLTQQSLKAIPTESLRQLSGFVSAELLLRMGTVVPSMSTRPTRADFRIGQRVTFRNRYGSDVTIRIDRINQKTLGGSTDEGMGWRVSPGLCRFAV